MKSAVTRKSQSRLKIRTNQKAEEINRIFGNDEGLSLLTDRFAAKEVSSAEDEEKFHKVIDIAYLSAFKSSRMKKEKTYAEFLAMLRSDYELSKDRTSAIIVWDRQKQAPVAAMRLIHKGELALEHELTPSVQLKSLRRRGIRMAEAGRFALTGNGFSKGNAFLLLGRMMISILIRESVDLLFIASIQESMSLIRRLGLQKINKDFHVDQVEHKASIGWGQTLQMLETFKSLSKEEFPLRYKTGLIWFAFKIKIRRFLAAFNINDLEKVILNDPSQ